MASDPPLLYRLRPEIEWTPIQGRRRQWWVAKDPLRSSIFRCSDEVRRLLQWLDGQRSIQDLFGLLSQNASKQRISLQSIHNTIRSAIQKQMLIPSIRGDGTRSTFQEVRTIQPPDSLASWVRFVQRSPWSLVQGKRRIGNAEEFLKKLANHTDWLFSSIAVRLWMSFIFLSALLVFAKAAAQNLFALPNIATTVASNAAHWLIILLLTRVVHELGHAIVCVRMGARCREFGLFFMLGIACPYVDVTDSWRLSNPKARMAIAAAGVYVEWIVAAIAGLIWYFSQASWLNSVSWQVMVVCSTTTLLINANPLMRYDGYFLLSDYLETVNLREESENAFSKLAQRCWPIEQAKSYKRRLSWQDFGLLVFACSSWFYRCTLTVALIWSVHTICTRWQLPILGWTFGALMVISFLIIPLGQKMFQSWSAARSTPNGPYRLITMWLGCVALVVNLGWLPLPNRIACKGSVQPESQTFVYTQASGRIPLASTQDSFKPYLGNGTPSSSESLLVSLENPWIEDHARLAIQRQRQIECKIAAARLAAYQEPSMIDQLPALTTLASIAEKQTQSAIKDVHALNVVTPSQMTWVPIELPSLESLDGTNRRTQCHTVHDLDSRGQWLPAGTPIGYVTNSNRVSIAASIPVSQLDNISVGMCARVRFDQLPSQVYEAKVVEISGWTAAPDNLVRNQPNGNTVDREASDLGSLVSVSLLVEDASQKTLAMGGTADVVMWSKPKSLYYHIAHFAGATFGPNVPQIISR